MDKLTSKIFGYLASVINSTVKEGGLSTNTIELGHIDDHIRGLVKQRVPYEDFYRSIARPEAYTEVGWDTANTVALQKLKDFDAHPDRADHNNLNKLEIIREAASKSDVT